jgi:hypothetical protein
MTRLPRTPVALWVMVLILAPLGFGQTLHFETLPSISTNSIYIPFHSSTSRENFTLEYQLDVVHLEYPVHKYLIHSYQRKNITALSEISELRWSGTNHSIAIGRNYIHSGPTIRNASLFSAFTPSLNHIALHSNIFSDWKFEYQLIRLDDRQADLGTYKRWLYYRRLQFSVGDNWKVGLKDAVVATGLQRGMDLSYLNPGAVFQLEQLHGNVEQGTAGQNNDNQIMGIDIEYRYNKSSRLYFDSIVDEFQIDVADRDHAQDVFGMTLGIEYTKPKRQTFFEYWFGSPWLYTNGGTYTNVEVNNIPLGFLSPNAYGISIGWIQDYQKYRTNMLINIHKQGEQTVNTTWNSVDNRIPLLLPEQNWQPELDLRLGFKNRMLLKEIRLTYNILNSEGLFLILKFSALNKQWTEKP